MKGAQGGKDERHKTPALLGAHDGIFAGLAVGAIAQRLLKSLAGKAFGVDNGDVNHGAKCEVGGSGASFEWYAIVLDERRYKLTGKSSRRLMGDGTSERLTKGERR